MKIALHYPSKNPSSVQPARNWHWQYIADNLRWDERAHWLALTGFEDYHADTAAASWMTAQGLKIAVIGRDGYPHAAGTFTRIRPGVMDGWMCCTERGWLNGWREVTKAVRWFMGQQFKQGAHRLQIMTLESRAEACQWYKDALGMQLDGLLPKAGAKGENLVIYSRLAGGAR